MKSNYYENQYIQLAKQLFSETLNKIPYVSNVEIRNINTKDEFGSFYALVKYSDTDDLQKFCIEVKSNGERRYVNTFMEVTSKFDDACYVFMAPYISESSAVNLINNCNSFMDLSGNCYILTKRIIMHYQGKENKYLLKKEKKQYFSKSSSVASHIIRTMLDKPYERWGVKSLSEMTGKAIGTVSNVKNFLKDRLWIEEYQNGFELKNIKELLYEWSKDYHKKDSLIYEYYSLDSIPEIEKHISEWNMINNNKVYLGHFSAAARYTPTVRYQRINLYIDLQFLTKFIEYLDLKPVGFGGNVIITIPHDETVEVFSRKINGDYVTSPVQTVIDLLGNAGRGEEAAKTIIQKEYGVKV